jgi:hypothetical protein
LPTVGTSASSGHGLLIGPGMLEVLPFCCAGEALVKAREVERKKEREQDHPDLFS